MAKTKIHNLQDLLDEKARIHAQLQIVQEELGASAGRTREAFGDFMESKLSIPRQIGQALQGGASQGAGASAIGALGRVAGLGPLWSTIVATIAPFAMNFAKNQWRKRQERKQTQGTEELESENPVETPRRGIFRRKSKETPPQDDQP